MELKKICCYCGENFCVPHWREKAKFCSRECSDNSRIAKPNVVCSNCGKQFHMKKYRQFRTNRNCGYFCSKKCFNEYKKIWFKGENNHQYGLRGSKNASFKNEDTKTRNKNNIDIHVYYPNHPYATKSGRVLLHRLTVELNHELFPNEYFNVIDGFFALKENLVVHHIDCNHQNNNIANLQVLTKGEHTRTHNIISPRCRDKITGRFVKDVDI